MKQRRRRRVRIAGLIQRKETGRPEYVLTRYGRRIREDELEHEVLITDFVLLFPDWTFERFVKAGRAEPDLVMTRDGRRLYVEIERTRKSSKQLAAKFEKYDSMGGFVLVVCLTEKRMQRVRQNCEAAKDLALYSTFARLTSEMPEPWIDGYGNTVRI